MNAKQLIQIIARQYGYASWQIMADQGRARDLVRVRQHCMNELTQRMGMIQYDIATALGYKGKMRHCNISHGIRMYGLDMETNFGDTRKMSEMANEYINKFKANNIDMVNTCEYKILSYI